MIRHVVNGDRDVVRINHDSLTIYTYATMSACLCGIVPSLTRDMVVVDLGNVSDIDSTGVGLLARFQGDCAARGLRMALSCTRGRILKVFDLLNMRPVFSFIPSSEACPDAVS